MFTNLKWKETTCLFYFEEISCHSMQTTTSCLEVSYSCTRALRPQRIKMYRAFSLGVRAFPFHEQRSQYASDIPLLRAKGAFFSPLHFSFETSISGTKHSLHQKQEAKIQRIELVEASEVFPSSKFPDAGFWHIGVCPMNVSQRVIWKKKVLYKPEKINQMSKCTFLCSVAKELGFLWAPSIRCWTFTNHWDFVCTHSWTGFSRYGHQE